MLDTRESIDTEDDYISGLTGLAAYKSFCLQLLHLSQVISLTSKEMIQTSI